MADNKILDSSWQLLLISLDNFLHQLKLILMVVFKKIVHDVLLALVGEDWHLWVLKVDFYVAEAFSFAVFAL